MLDVPFVQLEIIKRKIRRVTFILQHGQNVVQQQHALCVLAVIITVKQVDAAIMSLYQIIQIRLKLALFQLGRLLVQLLDLGNARRNDEPDFMVKLPLVEPLVKPLVIPLHLLPRLFQAFFRAVEPPAKIAKRGVPLLVAQLVHQIENILNAVVPLVLVT